MGLIIDCRLMFYRKAGIGNYTRRLVQGLAAIGNRPWAICVLMDRRDKDTSWVPPNCKIRRTLTPAHHKYEHLTLPFELAISNYQLPITLLHSPDFITCKGRFKKVITLHDLYFMEHPEAMSADGARYYGRVRKSARHADKIIAVSHFTHTEILRLMPEISPNKITVIHEAADQSPTPNLQSPIPKLPIPNPFCLFVGTFEPRKNLSTLLRALALTPNEIKLVIVGESGWVAGSEPMQLAQELGLSQRVHLAGRVSDAELDQLYRQARCVLVPSLAEGFGSHRARSHVSRHTGYLQHRWLVARNCGRCGPTACANRRRPTRQSHHYIVGRRDLAPKLRPPRPTPRQPI